MVLLLPHDELCKMCATVSHVHTQAQNNLCLLCRGHSTISAHHTQNEVCVQIVCLYTAHITVPTKLVGFHGNIPSGMERSEDRVSPGNLPSHQMPCRQPSEIHQPGSPSSTHREYIPTPGCGTCQSPSQGHTLLWLPVTSYRGSLCQSSGLLLACDGVGRCDYTDHRGFLRIRSVRVT